MTVIVSAVIVLADEFVAEKPGRLGTGMRNQRFLFRQVHFEVALEEVGDGMFDRLGFMAWASESKQKVIGVATIAEASVGRIMGVARRKVLGLNAKVSCFLVVTILVQFGALPA